MYTLIVLCFEVNLVYSILKAGNDPLISRNKRLFLPLPFYASLHFIITLIALVGFSLDFEKFFAVSNAA